MLKPLISEPLGTDEVTAAAQLETGAIIQIGAAVASIPLPSVGRPAYALPATASDLDAARQWLGARSHRPVAGQPRCDPHRRHPAAHGPRAAGRWRGALEPACAASVSCGSRNESDGESGSEERSCLVVGGD